MRDTEMRDNRSSLIRQKGVAAVELGIVAIVMFTMIFGTIELARAFYLFNTLQESTRRAAANAATVNFADQTALDAIKNDAVFREDSGPLFFGGPVTDQHIAIDYMALVRASDGTLSMQAISSGDMPSSPARNRQICMSNPNDPGCVRFVRVQICQPDSGAACERVPYQPLTGLINLSVDLPKSTTIIPAESLGYVFR